MRLIPAVLVALLALGACDSGEPPADDGAPAPGVAKPVDPEASRLCMEGEALVASDPEKAIEVLTRSIERAETSRAHLARARARLETADSILPGMIPEDVAPDLRKARSLDPQNTAAMFFEARLLGLGRRDGQDLLDQILELPAADGPALMVRARAAAGRADNLTGKEAADMLARSLKDFEAAGKQLPANAELCLLWGHLLYRKLGRDEAAEPILSKCVRLDPGGSFGREAQRLLDEM